MEGISDLFDLVTEVEEILNLERGAMRSLCLFVSEVFHLERSRSFRSRRS